MGIATWEWDEMVNKDQLPQSSPHCAVVWPTDRESNCDARSVELQIWDAEIVVRWNRNLIRKFDDNENE